MPLAATLLFVGSYTTAERPNGLCTVRLDTSTGALGLVRAYGVENPLSLAKSADGRFLYTTAADGLASFAVGAEGDLVPLDTLPLGAKVPCHLALADNDRVLVWAAYTSGEAGAVRVAEGRFLGSLRRDRHTGHGPDPRQEAAHCHAAVPTPDGAHYAVADLGCDELVTYPWADPTEPGRVFPTAPAGAGPRHLLFHPDGAHAFVVFELGSRLASYAWQEATGFRPLDSVSTLPPTWHGLNQDAALRFTPDGRRLVVSNRGYDALTVFDCDLASGKLSLKARTILPGNWPRDFIFIPGTDLAVVAMERSSTLLSVRYDAATGSFTPLDTLHGLYRPVAVLH